MAFTNFIRQNPAGSVFNNGGGTLAQLAPQPTHGMRPNLTPATALRSGTVSSTTSPGMMGPTGPIIPPGPNQQPFPSQPPVAAMAQPAASPAPFDRQSWLESTPGYQFRFNEGMDAINKSAAANGTLLTGGTLKALQERGQGLASQEFGAEADRLARLTQLGQSGAQQLGNYGTGYSATNAGLAEVGANNAIGLGNAQAGGTLAQVNAGNAAGSQIANTLGQVDWAKLFGRRKPVTTPPIMGGGIQDVTATA